MKICVSATGGDLNAQVDPRFGRCQYFVIVERETMQFEAMQNEAITAPGGAGIQAAQTIVNKGADVVISGNIGPNAFQVLTTAGVKIVTGAFGTVKEAVEMYNGGRISESGGATVAAHAGMGGTGMGMGRGSGRGMGRGGGMGMRSGLGMQQMPVQAPSQATPTMMPPTPTKEQEIQILQEQANALEEQLKQIMKRLEEIKKE